MTIEISELRSTAEEAAADAGELLMSKWSKPRQIKNKGFRDWVTDADLAAQEMITSHIIERYPRHGFINEEDSPHLPTSGEVVWIIDPLDGTSNYSRKQPLFCVSIAAAITRSDQSLHIVAGAIYDPIRKELFSAADSQGRTLNGRPIAVSPTNALETSIIGMDWSRGENRRQAIIEVLGRTAHLVHTIRAIGSAALALAWVACGRSDLYFNLGIGPWDVSAAKIIILEAGGLVTDHRGTDWSIGNSSCIASNGQIHESFINSSLLGLWNESN